MKNRRNEEQKIPQDIHFQTHLLDLVTCLMCSGFHPIETSRENNRVIFYFADSEDLRKIEREFFQRELSMEPRRLFETARDIKRLYIYSD